MKKVFFVLTLLFTSNAFAATGSGHAQTELETPLKVTSLADVTFQTIAIDPSAGPQVLTMEECPATYVCTGPKLYGFLDIRGAPSTVVHASLTGSTATLSDGAGNTITFDPFFRGAPRYETLNTALSAGGALSLNVDGLLYLTGNEPAGTYSSKNAGGSGYQITVNY
ncbi:MAG: DUF4402 domain-containing protein [Alphaproteobacteria bacterium]|nr:DUF4402 domain-containing protein [Alphaproteobacteria bacterium]MBN2779462.1 DUF4402 domain-containing protein [Alphaproteobacteria bacterium]